MTSTWQHSIESWPSDGMTKSRTLQSVRILVSVTCRSQYPTFITLCTVTSVDSQLKCLCVKPYNSVLMLLDYWCALGWPCHTCLQQVEKGMGQPMSLAQIIAMDWSVSVWRSLWPSAGHAQQWVSECITAVSYSYLNTESNMQVNHIACNRTV